MKNIYTKILKLVLTSIFFITTFTSCTQVVDGIAHTSSKIVKEIAHKAPNNHKNITGSNDFHSLVKNMVSKASFKLKKNVQMDDVVLVSDFVNLDNLENRSKLGFLLSDHLKDSLLNKDIIVRQVELSQEFQYGRHGLNLLTRNHKDIKKKYVDSITDSGLSVSIIGGSDSAPICLAQFVK